MNLYAIGGIALAVLAGAAVLFFKLYVGQVEQTGALKGSNTALTTTIEVKKNALQQRATIERRNSSADYPALVDKLR
jgi:hypothetical protein